MIHGAGVIEDRLLIDKTLDSFERVIVTKVRPLEVLVAALKPESLRFLALFSSVTSRQGNRGQADYSAANEVLNKVALHLSRQWQRRVVALGWGPWEGKGMVSPEVMRQFKERGIDLVPPHEGVEMFVREVLAPSDSPAEVVIGALSDVLAAQADAEPSVAPALPLTQDAEFAQRSDGTFILRKRLLLTNNAYLKHHMLDGKPVLPFAFAMELMAEAASAALPGLSVRAIRDVRVFRGVIIDGDGVELDVSIGPPQAVGGDVITAAASIRHAGNEQIDSYRAVVELQPTPTPVEAAAPAPLTEPAPPFTVAEAYRDWLFHGPSFQVIESIEAIGPTGATAHLRTTNADEYAGGSGGSWLLDPVLIDAAFQMQLIWGRFQWDITLLPAMVSRLSRYHGSGAGELLRCEMRIRKEAQSPISHCDFWFYNAEGQLVGRSNRLRVRREQSSQPSRGRRGPHGQGSGRLLTKSIENQDNLKREAIAIVGMACLYPGARNVHEFWRNILGSVDSVTDPPPGAWDPGIYYDPDSLETDRIYCKRGGYIEDLATFDPLLFGVPPKDVGGEPDQWLALKLARDALIDAGYADAPDEIKRRTAVILGRGQYPDAGSVNAIQHSLIVSQTLDIIRSVRPDLGESEIEEFRQQLKGSLPRFGADIAPALTPNMTVGRIANRFNLMGPNYAIDAACASSLVAIKMASRELLNGDCDMALAGGSQVWTSMPILSVFGQMGALSRSERIRPFDKEADGTILGEGVGLVVLKRLSDAERDGDRIYAVVRGIGIASDGKSNGLMAPRVEGQVLAMQRAYEDAGVSPDTVELIEAHGTGTPVGDAVEIRSMTEVFGKRRGPGTERSHRLRQVHDRPRDAGSGRGGHHQDGAGAASQGATAQPALRRAQPEVRAGQDAFLRQRRHASLDRRARPSQTSRRQRFRLRRHQRPRRAGGVHPGA